MPHYTIVAGYPLSRGEIINARDVLKYRMGYVGLLVPKPNVSGLEGINSRSRGFDLILFSRLDSICRLSCRRSRCRRYYVSLVINYQLTALIAV